jgi:sterol desaturase/sphingolipid hydroxylase (fatty acid hydroxylase superfamily)
LDFSPGVSYFVSQLGKAFLAPGSQASLYSLLCAFAIGFAVLAERRRRRGRPIRPKPLLRAMFPKSVVTSRSTLADVLFFYFNVFVFGLLFGWAVLSFATISHGVFAGLVAAFGALPAAPLPGFISRLIVTVMVFLGYELGYWLNHWLSHRVPFLWEFHKVHHSATVLTPVTNFRVHPAYMCVFINILSVVTGLANGLGGYLLGQEVDQFGLSGSNIILVVFIYSYVHLQHSQIWIPFTGWLGRVFMSPAHHQLHHSNNPAHFNKNMGSCLALWDWMFGTLYVPSRDREAFSFGLGEPGRADHTIRGELIVPFYRAVQVLTGGPAAPVPNASPLAEEGGATPA